MWKIYNSPWLGSGVMGLTGFDRKFKIVKKPMCVMNINVFCEYCLKSYIPMSTISHSSLPSSAPNTRTAYRTLAIQAIASCCSPTLVISKVACPVSHLPEAQSRGALSWHSGILGRLRAGNNAKAGVALVEDLPKVSLLLQDNWHKRDISPKPIW